MFARIYENNDQKWVPAQVVENVGSQIYKVRLQSNARIIRSHINQLRIRHMELVQDEFPEIPMHVLVDLGSIDPESNPPHQQIDNDVTVQRQSFDTIQQPRRSGRTRRPPNRYSP